MQMAGFGSGFRLLNETCPVGEPWLSVDLFAEMYTVHYMFTSFGSMIIPITPLWK